MSGRIHCAFALAAVAVVGFGPVRDLSAERPAIAREAAVSFEVEKHADIAYRTDAAADAVRHKLDLYVPTGAKEFPVLLYVHGGAWKNGAKSLYIALGRAFARHGIGVAVINYRLSPAVKHPAHAEDVASAFAWVHGNIAKFGGDPNRIILMGHSAGAHLVGLLATDPHYLKAEKLEPSEIRGVIAVSGIYRIDPDSYLTIPAFGTDAESCKKASPMEYVAGKLPPFLIAYAENDYEQFDRMAIDFQAALEKNNTPATLLKLMHRNHISEIVSILSDGDALNQAVRKFIFETK